MADFNLTHAQIGDLPSAPNVVLRLHSLMRQEDVGSHEIARVVETDAALVAKILKLVNSPFYGYAGKISTIDEAIAILGSNSVHQLVLATSVFNTLGGYSDRALDIQGYWWHSLGVGTFAKLLLTKADRERRNEAVMCGLLHDVGHLLFAKMDPLRFQGVFTSQGGVVTISDETQFFGITHPDLGAKLAAKWNFPESISAAIASHHDPTSAPERYFKLVSAVHVADIITQALGIGMCATPFVSEFEPAAWDTLGLDESELRQIMHDGLDEIEALDQALGH